ncbi:hypothetical protein [Metallosphaera hakonensis]|uniref:hypothetical protein n=1 Tax=Metallosphaera hakonensis TaxID=79601 RepID=UPI0006D25111|nr:hypothetical protein [Metallosphaera hakonensis]
MAEQSQEFIGNNEKVMDLLERLPSVILNPYSLSLQYYLESVGDIRFKPVQPEEEFKGLSKYQCSYLTSKYGDIFATTLKKIVQGDDLNLEDLKIVVDSIKFFPQRSWITGNDISVLSHNRGAFLASLRYVTVVEISNPFLSSIRKLKDLEGIFAITRIFLYHLNEIILNLSRNICKKIIIEDGLSKYDSPLIDFFTPLIWYTDHRSIVLFLDKDRVTKLPEFVKEAVEKTLNEVLSSSVIEKAPNEALSRSNFSEHLSEIVHEIYITNKIIAETNIIGNKQSSQSPGQDLTDTTRQLQDSAKRLNELLNLGEKGEPKRIKDERIEVRIRGFPVGHETCDICKVRGAVNMKPEIFENLMKKGILDSDEKICNICLGVRLSSYYLGRSSGVRFGDENTGGGNQSQGWGHLLQFKPHERRGRSLDDLADSSDDVIYVIIKPDLDIFKRNDSEAFMVNPRKYYIKLLGCLELSNCLVGKLTNDIKSKIETELKNKQDQQNQDILNEFLKRIDKLREELKRDPESVGERFFDSVELYENGLELNKTTNFILGNLKDLIGGKKFLFYQEKDRKYSKECNSGTKRSELFQRV